MLAAGEAALSIDPRQLQILLDVSRTGSFSAAAKLRNVSQPAISMAVAQLERQLGLILLERSRRGVSLTAAGTVLARRAEVIEQQLAAAQEEVVLGNIGVDGPLVIGGTPGALASLVPGAVRVLAQAERKLSLRVIEASDPQMNDMLRSGKIDLALTTIGVEALSPDLEELEIERDNFEVVVGLNHPLVGPHVDLADLAEYPWVLPNVEGGYRRQVDALFFASQVRTPANVVRCDSLATTKEIVRLAGYITLFPRHVIAADLSGGTLRCIPLKGRNIVRSIGFRRLSGGTPTALAREFIAAVQGRDMALPLP